MASDRYAPREYRLSGAPNARSAARTTRREPQRRRRHGDLRSLLRWTERVRPSSARGWQLHRLRVRRAAVEWARAPVQARLLRGLSRTRAALRAQQLQVALRGALGAQSALREDVHAEWHRHLLCRQHDLPLATHRSGRPRGQYRAAQPGELPRIPAWLLRAAPAAEQPLGSGSAIHASRFRGGSGCNGRQV